MLAGVRGERDEEGVRTEQVIGVRRVRQPEHLLVHVRRFRQAFSGRGRAHDRAGEDLNIIWSDVRQMHADR